MKLWILTMTIAACAAVGFGDELEFSQNRAVDYQPHPNVGNPYAMVSGAAGGVVFTDGYNDAFMQALTPLTTDGTNDNAANTQQVIQLGTFGSGMSFQGATYDGTAYYACGITGTASCQLARTVSGSPWTGAVLTVSPDGFYSGVTAVAANTLVMPNFDTGAIQFFTVSGSTATASGTAIANPNATGFKTTQAFYYVDGATKVIFVYMANDTTTRRIDYFNTDGTPAGTTYGGTLAAGIASDMPVAGHYKQKFANLTADSASKILVAAVNASNTNGSLNGFDSFDISTISAGKTASRQIRGGDFSITANPNCAGLAFFTVGANKYLAATHSNHMIVFSTATPSASAKDWQLLD